MATFDSGTTRKYSPRAADTATANIYAIQDATTAATIKLVGTGDAVYVEGLSSEFTIRATKTSVTLKSATQTITINLTGSTGPQKLVLIDGEYSLVKGAKSITVNGTAVTKLVELDSIDTTDNSAANDYFNNGGSGSTGTTFTLTAGIDQGAAYVGTSADDTFNAASTADTLSVFDTLVGGLGNDTLNAVLTGTTLPALLSVTGIETANLNTSGAGFTADVTGWTGLTSLNVQNTSAAAAANIAITAAATTAVSVNALTDGDLTITGGRNAIVSDTSADDMLITGVTGSVTVTAGNEAGDIVSVNTSGSTTTSVNVLDGGIVAIGDGLTALADVTFNDDAVTDTLTSVSIASNLGLSTINSDVLTSLTLASSNQNSTVTAAAGTRALGLTINGLTGGTITDATATTLNITSSTTATTGVTVDAGAATNVTLASNVATTLAALTAGVATTVDISGSAATVITADTLAAGAVITSTNTGGVTITQELLAGQQFVGTSSSGADVINVAASTVAHSTGAGNDTVTISAAMGTGGSINAGDGTADVLRMTATLAATLDDNTTFNGTVSNFERLSLTAATNQTIDLDNIDGISYVTEAGTGNTLTLNNLASGGTLVFSDASTATAIGIKNAAAGTADVANLSVSSNAGVNIGTVTIANTETVNFATDDSADTVTNIAHTASLVAAAATTVTVTGDAGLALTNTDTTITRFDASAVTAGAVTWNTGALAGASVINGGAGADSLNAANAVAAVTLSGNAGADTLTGSSTIASTINGGAGNDTITGGAAADSINGGDNTDTYVANDTEDAGASNTLGQVVNLGATALTQAQVFATTGNYLSAAGTTVAANAAAYLFGGESSTNGVVVDTLTSIENVTGSADRDYIVGSAAANVIAGGAGADWLTGGAGIDTYNDVGIAGNSIIASADTLAVGGIAATNTITFATGVAGSVDIITDFAATDLLDLAGVTAATAPTTMLALADTTDLTAGTAYVAYGTYAAGTGVFTVAAAFDATTARDALLVVGDAGALTFVTTTGYVVLDNLSAALVAANFV